MDKLRIYNVKWTSYSAGPSSDNNRRTEIFLAGCSAACSGNPCPDCFNTDLWDKNNFCAEVTVEEAYNQIRKFAKNKYITFVGGEPLDQIKPLADLIELLSENGYDVIVITHYSWFYINFAAKNKDVPHAKLLKYASIIIDGKYNKNLRIWDESKAGDNIHDVIGSGNQNVVDLIRYRKNLPHVFPAGQLTSWSMNNEGIYEYTLSKEVS